MGTFSITLIRNHWHSGDIAGVRYIWWLAGPILGSVSKSRTRRMPRRYRLVRNDHPNGGFAEFSAFDDAAAIADAQVRMSPQQKIKSLRTSTEQYTTGTIREVPIT